MKDKKKLKNLRKARREIVRKEWEKEEGKVEVMLDLMDKIEDLPEELNRKIYVKTTVDSQEVVKELKNVSDTILQNAQDVIGGLKIPEPVDEVSVKNLEDIAFPEYPAFPKEMVVSNLKDLKLETVKLNPIIRVMESQHNAWLTRFNNFAKALYAKEKPIFVKVLGADNRVIDTFSTVAMAGGSGFGGFQLPTYQATIQNALVTGGYPSAQTLITATGYAMKKTDFGGGVAGTEWYDGQSSTSSTGSIGKLMMYWDSTGGTMVAVTAANPLPVDATVNVTIEATGGQSLITYGKTSTGGVVAHQVSTTGEQKVFASDLDIRQLSSTGSATGDHLGLISASGTMIAISHLIARSWLLSSTGSATGDHVGVMTSTGYMMKKGDFGGGSTGPFYLGIQPISATGTIAVTQSGIWSAGRTWLLNSTGSATGDHVGLISSTGGLLSKSDFGGGSTGPFEVTSPNATGFLTQSMLATSTGGIYDGRDRSWSLATGTDSVTAIISGTVAVTQSGTWSVGRTWILNSTGSSTGDLVALVSSTGGILAKSDFGGAPATGPFDVLSDNATGFKVLTTRDWLLSSTGSATGDHIGLMSATGGLFSKTDFGAGATGPFDVLSDNATGFKVLTTRDWLLSSTGSATGDHLGIMSSTGGLLSKSDFGGGSTGPFNVLSADSTGFLSQTKLMTSTGGIYDARTRSWSLSSTGDSIDTTRSWLLSSTGSATGDHVGLISSTGGLFAKTDFASGATGPFDVLSDNATGFKVTTTRDWLLSSTGSATGDHLGIMSSTGGLLQKSDFGGGSTGPFGADLRVGSAAVTDANAVPIEMGLKTTARTTPAAINASSTGDNTIVAGTASQTIRVHKLFFTVAEKTNVTFKNGTGTNLSGAMMFTAGGSIMLNFDAEPYFITTTGNAFIINMSDGVQMSGTAYYSKS